MKMMKRPFATPGGVGAAAFGTPAARLKGGFATPGVPSRIRGGSTLAATPMHGGCDVILDCFSRLFLLCTAPHALCHMLYCPRMRMLVGWL